MGDVSKLLSRCESGSGRLLLIFQTWELMLAVWAIPCHFTPFIRCKKVLVCLFSNKTKENKCNFKSTLIALYLYSKDQSNTILHLKKGFRGPRFKKNVLEQRQLCSLICNL